MLSMVYGIDAKSKDKLWLVFDFDAGNFDTTLVKVEKLWKPDKQLLPF